MTATNRPTYAPERRPGDPLDPLEAGRNLVAILFDRGDVAIVAALLEAGAAAHELEPVAGSNAVEINARRRAADLGRTVAAAMRAEWSRRFTLPIPPKQRRTKRMSDCDCDDGAMAWPIDDSAPALAPPGPGRWIERCDDCARFETDLDAAVDWTVRHAAGLVMLPGKYGPGSGPHPWAFRVPSSVLTILDEADARLDLHDVELPHVLVVVDPKLGLEERFGPAVGTFPNMIDAWAAADRWQASLNEGNTDTPFRVFAIPLLPPSAAVLAPPDPTV